MSAAPFGFFFGFFEGDLGFFPSPLFPEGDAGPGRVGTIPWKKIFCGGAVKGPAGPAPVWERTRQFVFGNSAGRSHRINPFLTDVER